MSDNIIEIKEISKQYRIRQFAPYLALRDIITDIFKAPLRGLGRGSAAAREQEYFWALRDVSFNVKQGETVGIIGRNGAGKTTLLKILSRITYPTKGEIKLRGRVASLLEVGTGFHPELTGRENIYFNGSILGMKKKEIDKNFDEIVAFAEVEKFIDTPVKRYSSGMQLRLAFSVAAHLEPEILLVDEVLAVGDVLFQKKCLGKMDEVARAGRTVLFVSHNMAAIQRLCAKGIVLDQGGVKMIGAINEAIDTYIGLGIRQDRERVWKDINQAPGNNVVRLSSVRFINNQGEVCTQFDVHEPITLEIEYVVLENGHQICVDIVVTNAAGQALLVSFDDYIKGSWGKQDTYPTGLHKSACLIPADLMSEGDIFISLWIFSPPEKPNENPHVRELEVLRCSIVDNMDPRGVRGNFPYEWSGIAVRPRLLWQHTFYKD